MKLSTIYLQHFNLIGVFLEKSTATANYALKSRFEEEASSHQIIAGNIAHCMAIYGDINVDKEKFEKLIETAIDLPCVYANPWTRGLYSALDDTNP